MMPVSAPAIDTVSVYCKSVLQRAALALQPTMSLALLLALLLAVNPARSAADDVDGTAASSASEVGAEAEVGVGAEADGGIGAEADGGRVADDTDPARLIRSMSRALRELNYEGTFVHMQGMSVSTLHILHASDGDGELERMRSLDGEAREIIRDHSLVTCIWPGTQSVVVSKSKPRRLLPDVDASLAGNASYRLRVDGLDRVADRETRVVSVVPQDSYRYGYRFWIDDETRMLLRSMMLDGNRSVEQVVFTTIVYPDYIDRSRFEFSEDDEHITWIEPKVKSAIDAFLSSGPAADSSLDGDSGSDIRQVVAGDEGRSRQGRVSVDSGNAEKSAERVYLVSLPAGYRKLSESYEPMPGQQAPISHVMLSDGMASVSVYVEHVSVAEQNLNLAGLSSMGAMNAFGLSLSRGFVTVVGDVPADTVVSIAEAVRLPE